MHEVNSTGIDIRNAYIISGISHLTELFCPLNARYSCIKQTYPD